MCNRLMVSFSLFILLIVGFTPSANASWPVGAPCVKSGATMKAKISIYTCIKSGKKLVWNTGVPIPASTPPPTALLGYLDALVGQASAIPSIAFAVVQKSALQVPRNPINLNIILGPNSQLLNPEVVSGIRKANSIWANFSQPLTEDVVLFNYQDVDWAQQKMNAIRPSIDPQIASKMCDSIDHCGDGRSFGVNNGRGLIAVAIPGKYAAEIQTNGGELIHEYTHTVQAMNSQINNLRPMWWDEAVANFAGLSTSSVNLSDYLGLRRWTYEDMILYPKLDTHESAIAEHLLAHQIWEPPVGNPPGWQEAGYGYGIGLLFVEALSAINGIDPIMQVTTNSANGVRFVDAFKSSFGFSFTDAVNVIVPIISSEIIGISNFKVSQ